MSFKKPFRAVPVRLGPDALARRRQARRKAARTAVVQVLGIAVLGGMAICLMLSFPTNGAPSVARSKSPPAGAYYAGCDAARAAGVAFGADPVSGRRGTAIVSAVPGLGASLVSGETDADTWLVDRHGRIVERRIVIGHERSPIETTHNDLRLAVEALSGGLPLTIYARRFESVRIGSDKFSSELTTDRKPNWRRGDPRPT